MLVIAAAEQTLDAPLARVFAQFIDFSSWDLWMPPVMRPISGPAGALREGDRLVVSLGIRPRVRSELAVLRVRPNHELCWRGGLPGLLVGEHSFFFREQDGKTVLRSEEPLSGLLVNTPLAGWVERIATRVGSDILTGFARHVARRA